MNDEIRARIGELQDQLHAIELELYILLERLEKNDNSS